MQQPLDSDKQADRLLQCPVKCQTTGADTEVSELLSVRPNSSCQDHVNVPGEGFGVNNEH